MTTATTTRVCDQCFQTKSITEFRCKKRGTDLRARECRVCHNETERLRQAEKRQQADDRKFAQFSAAIKRTRDEQRVAFLVSVMVDHFGGLEEFVKAWMCHINRAMEKSPGSKRVLDFFVAVTQMTAASDAFRRKPDPAEMGTDELSFAVRQEVRELIREQPEIAVSAAAELGWEVKPAADANVARA